MRLATWNVNSIRTRVDRVVDWMVREDVDVLAMQEIKCRPEQFPAEKFESAGYELALHGYDQWNGVAIASRSPIESIETAFPGMPGFQKGVEGPDLPQEARAMILAPLGKVAGREFNAAAAKVRKAGLVRVQIDGRVYDLDETPELSPEASHAVDAVVDRIVIRPDLQPRLGESVSLALRLGEGKLTVVYLDGADEWREVSFTTQHACPRCGCVVSIAQVTTVRPHQLRDFVCQCGQRMSRV